MENCGCGGGGEGGSVVVAVEDSGFFTYHIGSQQGMVLENTYSQFLI